MPNIAANGCFSAASSPSHLSLCSLNRVNRTPSLSPHPIPHPAPTIQFICFAHHYPLPPTKPHHPRSAFSHRAPLCVRIKGNSRATGGYRLSQPCRTSRLQSPGRKASFMSLYRPQNQPGPLYETDGLCPQPRARMGVPRPLLGPCTKFPRCVLAVQQGRGFRGGGHRALPIAPHPSRAQGGAVGAVGAPWSCGHRSPRSAGHHLPEPSPHPGAAVPAAIGGSARPPRPVPSREVPGLTKRICVLMRTYGILPLLPLLPPPPRGAAPGAAPRVPPRRATAPGHG